MIVREARFSDIPQIVQCNIQAKSEEDLIGYAPPRGFSEFHSMDRLREAWQAPNHVGDGTVFVCESDGVVRGYVLIVEDGETIEIDNLDVSMEYQGHGVGRKLVNFVENLACTKGLREITLGTTRNMAGIPWKGYWFWIRMGFETFDEVETDDGKKYNFTEIRMKKAVCCPGFEG